MNRFGNLSDLTIIILAAGKGTRFKTEKPKVLHTICGKPILEYILEAANNINSRNILVVVGHKANLVKGYLNENYPDVETVYQENQLGTAHAVFSVKNQRKNLGKNVLILPGDCPLLDSETLLKLVNKHLKSKSPVTILTSIFSNPHGYGRICRDKKGKIKKIVEELDAAEQEKKINEVNASVYCFNKDFLFENIEEINAENSQGEYYLTDIVEKAAQKGEQISSVRITESWQVMGVNDRIQLSEIEKMMWKKIAEYHMRNGVTIRDPNTCYIEAKVEIDKDTIIEPYCFIGGESKIGRDCIIGPFTQIVDTIIGSGTKINSSIIFNSTLGIDNNIGPYSYIRPETKTGKNVKIGAFCEIDTMSVASIRIGEGAIVTAGSVITEDIPPNYLANKWGKQKGI